MSNSHEPPPSSQSYAISASSSISSCSRHIKGWEERASRQHLQEELDKGSSSTCGGSSGDNTDNVPNHKTLGLVNRKGLGMELVASPVLLAKHSEWNGAADDHEDGLAGSSSLLPSTITTTTTATNTTTATTGEEVESTAHGLFQVDHDDYEGTPIRTNSATLAASVSMSSFRSMMRGQSNESPKGVEELTLARYLDGQDFDAYSEDGCKDNEKQNNDGTNGDKANYYTTTSDDKTSEGIMNANIKSRKSSTEMKMPTLLLSALRRRKGGKSQKPDGTEQQNLTTTIDDENAVAEFEPKKLIISAVCEPEGLDGETAEHEVTLQQHDHEVNETTGEDISIQTNFIQNDDTLSATKSFDTSAMVNDNQCLRDDQLQRGGLEDEDDIAEEEIVRMSTESNGRESSAVESSFVREACNDFKEYEEHDTLYPSFFSTLCDTLAQPDENSLEGNKTAAAMYSDSLLDRQESSISEMDHSVDTKVNANFDVGNSDPHTGAEAELTLTDYLQLQVDGTVVSSTDIHEGSKGNDEHPSEEVGNDDHVRQNQLDNQTDDTLKLSGTTSEKNEPMMNEAIIPTSSVPKPRNTVLNVLRQKIGARIGANLEVEMNSEETAPVAGDADAEAKHTDDRNGVDGKIKEKEVMNRRGSSPVEETIGCSPFDSICNTCGDFSFSRTDDDKEEGGERKSKMVGRLRRRREKRSSTKKKKSKEFQMREKKEGDEDLHQIRKNEADKKVNDSKRREIMDGEDKEADKKKDDKVLPVASCIGARRDDVTMVDNEFVGEVMDMANKAAVVLLRGVRDVLDTIDDKINGCLEDDNVDDGSESSSCKQDDLDDDEDVSTNIFVLPDPKRAVTTPKTSASETTSNSYLPSRKKLFSKFRMKKGGT